MPGRHRAPANLPRPLTGTATVAASGLLVAALGAATSVPAPRATAFGVIDADPFHAADSTQRPAAGDQSTTSSAGPLRGTTEPTPDVPAQAVPAPAAKDVEQHSHFGQLGFTGVTPEPELETPVATITTDSGRADSENLDGAGASAGSTRVEGQSASRSEARPEAPAEPVAPAAGQGGEAAIAWAQANLGLPYSWGSSSGGAYDCSGFTTAAFRAAGISLPHQSEAQYHATNRVPLSEIQRGDLLFYSNNGSASGIFHVAIYLGDGQVIHSLRDSSWSGSKINGINYASGLMGAGRP
nr:NlpC/P60 family protein [Ornithinimicrobium sp. F0845]